MNCISIGIMAAVIGIGVYYFKDGPEHGQYTQWQEADLNGDTIPCEEIKDSFKNPRYTIFRNARQTFTLSDFLYQSRYKFQQCESRIAELKDQYCETRVQYEMHRLETNPYSTGATEKTLYLCPKEIKSAYVNLNSHYQLPDENNHFLVMTQAGFMIPPAEIQTIQFRQLDNVLWAVNVNTSENSYAIYFSDKEKWQTALNDFAQINPKKADLTKLASAD